jgi:hypothetical protein
LFEYNNEYDITLLSSSGNTNDVNASDTLDEDMITTDSEENVVYFGYFDNNYNVNIRKVDFDGNYTDIGRSDFIGANVQSFAKLSDNSFIIRDGDNNVVRMNSDGSIKWESNISQSSNDASDNTQGPMNPVVKTIDGTDVVHFGDAVIKQSNGEIIYVVPKYVDEYNNESPDYCFDEGNSIISLIEDQNDGGVTFMPYKQFDPPFAYDGNAWGPVV